MNLGKWEIDDFVTFTCNTHDAATGAATDADAVPSYRVYEDETATPILTGTMALLDSGNTAGLYSERIQLTAASGFEVGKSYSIYISATVDSIEGTLSHSLQIEVEPANAAALATVDANVDAVLVDTGTTLPAEHATLATAAALGTVDTVVDAIKAVTDLLPDAGALNDLAAILVDTGTTLPAEHATLATAASIAALNDLASSDIQTVLEDNDLDHLLKVAHPTGDPVVDSIFDLVMNTDGSQTYDRTSDALEALGAAGGATPAQIADAVWDELIVGHSGAGSFGLKNQNQVPSETINDYKADVSALSSQASVDTIDANVDAILVDTGTTLPAEHALLATAAAIAALNDLSSADVATELATYDGPTRAEATSDKDEIIAEVDANEAKIDIIDANVDAILVDTSTTLPAEHATLATAADLATLDGKVDTIDTVVDAIKAVTDLLPDAGALTTIDSNIDAILVDTGTTLPAAIAALNDLSSADVQTVLETNDLDHLLKVAHPTGTPTINSMFDFIMNFDSGQTYNRTTDSLEKIAESSGLTADQVANAVWDEAAGDHTTSTTFGGKNQIGVPSATLNDYKADVSGLATAAALATVDSVVDAIKAVTDLLPDAGALTDLAAIKAVTDNLPDSGSLNDLAAILVDTGTTLPAQITALNDLAAADIQTVLETNDLDHLAKVAHPSGDPVADTLFDLIMNKDGSQTFDRSTDSLENISAAGGGSTPAAIADAVWDEDAADHTTADTFGDKNQNKVPSETIGDYKADVSGLATSAALATHDGKLDTVDTVVDAIKAVTDLLPDAGALTTIDGNIDAIKAVTDLIPDAGAMLDLALILADTGPILVDTGTTLPAQIAAIDALTAQEVEDAIWDADPLDHNSGGTFGGDIIENQEDILNDIDDLEEDLEDHDDDIKDDLDDLADDVDDVKTDTETIIATLGAIQPGAIQFIYNVTNTVSGQPIADADVWVTTDEAGTNVIASGKTDQNGDVTFYLDAGTIYMWRQKSGFNFDNPDTEVVS